jgi:hypothetical protein
MELLRKKSFLQVTGDLNNGEEGNRKLSTVDNFFHNRMCTKDRKKSKIFFE